MKKGNNLSGKERTANEFTNVKDIRNKLLYSKDGYIFAYLRVPFINIDLLPREEKKAKADGLAASFEGDKKDFVYMSLPREIDLDNYKDDLNRRYSQEIGDIGKRHILRKLLVVANELTTNGENFEHQHFIRIWKLLAGDKTECEQALKSRQEDFKSYYRSAGIDVEILDDQDILKLCNLFANGVQAPYDTQDGNMCFEPVAKMR